jgi:hypothetical protein
LTSQNDTSKLQLMSGARFRYENSDEQKRRVPLGLDHCRSSGQVYDLKDLIKGNRLVDPLNPDRTLTAGRSIGETERPFIYAVDANFRVRVGFDTRRGMHDAVKHETLFSNADVRAAGELEIRRGIVVEVGDVSGSYGTSGRIQTDRTFVDDLLTAFERIGVPMKKAEQERLRRRGGRK